MTDERITFGQYISKARKALGMSQKQLALSIKREDGKPISPQYLNDIERDRRTASSDHLIQQFASVLDLDANYLHYLNNRWPARCAPNGAHRAGRRRPVAETSHELHAHDRDACCCISATVMEPVSLRYPYFKPKRFTSA